MGAMQSTSRWLLRLSGVLGLLCLPGIGLCQTMDTAIERQFQTLREQVQQEHWQAVDAQLPMLQQHYALTHTQRDYLRLAEGLLWQARGEHRKAIPLYEAFQPGARYYAEARTNLAIAYLKQGWWSDAHRELEQLLGDSAHDSELKNRWRMMLGMSQLQQGFYRDARKTFGSLDQDSRHRAYAWRGIGLAALHLGDHTGALNAFHRLKADHADEVPEGAFLVAFTYDQMNRLAMAEANYREALLHYQHRLQQTERALEQASNEHLAELQKQQDQLSTLTSQSQYGLATVYDRQ